MKKILAESDLWWWVGRRFLHPRTNNWVNFQSLPTDYQQKLNSKFHGKLKPKVDSGGNWMSVKTKV